MTPSADSGGRYPDVDSGEDYCPHCDCPRVTFGMRGTACDCLCHAVVIDRIGSVTVYTYPMVSPNGQFGGSR